MFARTRNYGCSQSIFSLLRHSYMHALRWHLERMAESAHLELGKGMRRYSPYGGGRLHLRWHHTWLWSTTLTSKCRYVPLTQICDYNPSEKVIDAAALMLSHLVGHFILVLLLLSLYVPCNPLPSLPSIPHCSAHSFQPSFCPP